MIQYDRIQLFAYKSQIVLFLIAKVSHYIKYDILKKSSPNNNVGGDYMLFFHNFKTCITFDSVGILRRGF